MEQKEYAQMSDEELLKEAKKMKQKSILNAFVVGLMVGILIWSIAKNNLGILSLIPLYFIFLAIKKSSDYTGLTGELIKRGLK